MAIFRLAPQPCLRVDLEIATLSLARSLIGKAISAPATSHPVPSELVRGWRRGDHVATYGRVGAGSNKPASTPTLPPRDKVRHGARRPQWDGRRVKPMLPG